MKIGIIGLGNMGFAMAKGLAAMEGVDIGGYEKYSVRKEEVSNRIKISFCSDISAMASEYEYILVAVKQDDLKNVLNTIRDTKESAVRGLISVAAGISIDWLSKESGIKQISRFMPNLAASVGLSSVGVAFSQESSGRFKDICMQVTSAVGQGYEMPEKLIAAITGLSGSGIAFVFAFIQALALGGVHTGIAYPKSLSIALETIEGAVKVIRDSGITPADYITRVTSPGGTTIEGIRALEQGGFTASVMDAVIRAAEKAEDKA